MSFPHISNIDSQADRYRMTQHSSRQGWRSVKSIYTFIHSLTHLQKFQRGMSVIDYEITYPSSPRFVFHDSRGIEAGAESDSHATEAGEQHGSSKLCIEYLQKFIDGRAQQRRTRDQLHAIWYVFDNSNDLDMKAEGFEGFACQWTLRGCLAMSLN